MLPGVLLDRDGVIIQYRPDYVRTWADVFIFPQALKALARLRNYPYRVAIITNQSGIGRGIIDPIEAETINLKLLEAIRLHGGRIDGVFVCPHRPEEGCECRKPNNGLIIQAAKVLELDLENSLLVGDTLNDLRAGEKSGIPKLALVRTGLGAVQEKMLHSEFKHQVPVYDDIELALLDLIK